MSVSSDREPVESLCRNFSGNLYADKGYISRELFGKLYARGIRLVTGIRSNMKNRLMSLMDKPALRKRSLIETINDQLKNICDIEHTRHRSPANFLVNLVCGAGRLHVFSQKALHTGDGGRHGHRVKVETQVRRKWGRSRPRSGKAPGQDRH